MKITASIIVCTVAAAFTATVLLADPDPIRRAPAAPTVAGAAPEIRIEQFSFSAVTATPGATVVVTNADGVEHTASAVDGAFASGLVDVGASASFVAPTAPGTYAFICDIHPSMTGELVVAG